MNVCLGSDTAPTCLHKVVARRPLLGKAGAGEGVVGVIREDGEPTGVPNRREGRVGDGPRRSTPHQRRSAARRWAACPTRLRLDGIRRSDHVASRELSCTFCKSEDSVSDCLTKALTRRLFEKGLVGLGMINAWLIGVRLRFKGEC
jgi:hypothetical protein